MTPVSNDQCIIVLVVCSVRHPRRLLIGLSVAMLVLVLLTYRQMSPRGRQTKLLVKTGSHGEPINDDVEDWRQSINRRHHGRDDESINRLHVNVDDSSLDATRDGRKTVHLPSEAVSQQGEISQSTPDLDLEGIAEKKYEHASDERILESDPVKQPSDEVVSAAGVDSPALLEEAQYLQDKNHARDDIEQNDVLQGHKDYHQITNEELKSDFPVPVLTSGQASSGTFIGDLERVVDFNKIVILSVIDAGYVTMAVNFFRTSVANLGLKNFLMVCTDTRAVLQLRRQGIPCTPYRVPEVGEVTRHDCSFVSCIY